MKNALIPFQTHEEQPLYLQVSAVQKKELWASTSKRMRLLYTRVKLATLEEVNQNGRIGNETCL